MDNLNLKQTADGSSTLYNQMLDEHYHSIHGALNESIHVFINKNLENGETLWPYSMPPKINNELDINIATYGDTNMGQLKHVYRKGLARPGPTFKESILIHSVARILFSICIELVTFSLFE